ncbi:alpha/beta fold hydrolase [Corynebacterium anserum]|uniref:alpha/beta fold hydrolase n=1 Tax=Corynebacterium anserum TaxID=2684406 RepID=UPI001C92593B|nr:alpha/beta fold hydrolase [Corynebacterium anserum]
MTIGAGLVTSMGVAVAEDANSAGQSMPSILTGDAQQHPHLQGSSQETAAGSGEAQHALGPADTTLSSTRKQEADQLAGVAEKMHEDAHRRAGTKRLTAADIAPTPMSGTGPALTVPTEQLQKALHCEGDLAGGKHDPVLLIHGTTSSPQATWSWTWMPAFRAEGRSFCTVTLPGSGNEDIQISAEYVTHAIRMMHERAGRKIDIVGHSQGGMIPHWSLKWWPDTRAMVDDVVGLSPSNNGTYATVPFCVADGYCAPALYQQAPGSDFMTALHAGQMTFPGISYTTVSTTLDELVVPYQNGFLPLNEPNGGTVRNVVVQDHCPATPVEHFSDIANSAMYEITLDAFDHEGVTSYRGASYAGGGGSRKVSDEVCGRFIMPGVDINKLPKSIVMGLSQSAISLVGSPEGEPHQNPLSSGSSTSNVRKTLEAMGSTESSSEAFRELNDVPTAARQDHEPPVRDYALK